MTLVTRLVGEGYCAKKQASCSGEYSQSSLLSFCGVIAVVSAPRPITGVCSYTDAGRANVTALHAGNRSVAAYSGADPTSLPEGTVPSRR